MNKTRGFALYTSLTLSLAVASLAYGQDILNPGFESGWEAWTDGDPSGSGTSISEKARSGSSSVKLTEKSSFAAQSVAVQPHSTYRLNAYVLGVGTLGVKVGTELFFDQPTKKARDWVQLEVTFETGDATSISIFGSHAGAEGRFDDFSLVAVDGEAVQTSARVITSSAGGYGLSPDLPPGRNFDLLDWYLNTPADEDGDEISDRFSEIELAKGATDPRYFYTAEDGGMVFRATIGGAKTSKNTSYTRTELREMLRRGNTSIRTKPDGGGPNLNNWVFSSAPARIHKVAGGIDGTLKATLAVNHVTTTGDAGQVGRVIVGQIHAAKDEPIRLYYRKLPNNTRGSIYFAHEVSGGDDTIVEMIGSSARSAEDPADGIALDEKFSYEIKVVGNLLAVKIIVDGELRAQESFDMSASGYDVSGDYMYFKAGVYNQNNSGDPDDYVQATFYQLENSHDGYDY